MCVPFRHATQLLVIVLEFRGELPMNGQIIADLTAEHDRVKRQLHNLQKALTALHGGYNGGTPRKPRKPIKMSAAARKRISDAQKRRWAKVKR